MKLIAKFIFVATALLLAALTVFTPQALAQGGMPLWTNFYNGPGDSHDVAHALTVDSSGNVFVTGFSAGAAVLPDSYDYATLAYSSAGVPLWTNRYNGTGSGEDQA